MAIECKTHTAQPYNVLRVDNFDDVTEAGQLDGGSVGLQNALASNDTMSLTRLSKEYLSRVPTTRADTVIAGGTSRSAIHSYVPRFLQTQALRIQTHKNPNIRMLAHVLLGDMVQSSTSGSSVTDLIGLATRRFSKDKLEFNNELDQHMKSLVPTSTDLRYLRQRAKAKSNFSKEVIASIVDGTESLNPKVKHFADKFVSINKSMEATGRGLDSSKYIAVIIRAELVERLTHSTQVQTKLRAIGITKKQLDDEIFASSVAGGKSITSPSVNLGGKSLLDVIDLDVDQALSVAVREQASSYALRANGFKNTGDFRSKLNKVVDNTADLSPNDKDVLRQLVRELSGQPRFAEEAGTGLQVAKSLMQAAWLGKMGLTAIAEFGYYAGKYGTIRTMSTAMLSAKNLIRGVGNADKDIMKELYDVGMYFDEDARIFGTIAQLGDEVSSRGLVGLGSQAANLSATVSMINKVSKWQRVVNIKLFVDDIKKYDGTMTRALREAGWSGAQIRKVQSNIKEHGEDGNLGLAKWDNNQDVLRFMSTLERNVTQDVYKVGVGDRSAVSTGSASTDALLSFFGSMIGSGARQGSQMAFDSTGREATESVLAYMMFATMSTHAKSWFSAFGSEDKHEAMMERRYGDTTAFIKTVAESMGSNIPMLAHANLLGYDLAYQTIVNGESPTDKLPILSWFNAVGSNVHKSAHGIATGDYAAAVNGLADVAPAANHPVMDVLQNWVND